MINIIALSFLSIAELIIAKAFFASYDHSDVLTPVICFIVFCGMVCFNGFVIDFVEKATKAKNRRERW